MNDESLLQTYEASLRDAEALDRTYYLKRDPTPADRAAYYQRQQRAEQMRMHFYAALQASRSIEGQLGNVMQSQENGTGIAPKRSQPLCPLAHDLNNCLHVVLGQSELLSQNSSMDESASGRIENIVAATHKMTELMNTRPCRKT